MISFPNIVTNIIKKEKIWDKSDTSHGKKSAYSKGLP